MFNPRELVNQIKAQFMIDYEKLYFQYTFDNILKMTFT